MEKTFTVTHCQFLGITLVDHEGKKYASLGNKYGLSVGDTITAKYRETVKGVENGIEYQHIELLEKL